MAIIIIIIIMFTIVFDVVIGVFILYPSCRNYSLLVMLA